MTETPPFPKYDHYKDSGIPWLGQIPEHWAISSIRAVTELKSEKNQPDLPVLSVYREFGVILKDSRDDNHNVTSLNTSTYKAVRKGDFVVNKMKAWQGSMGVSEYEGIVSPAYITCRIKQDKMLPKYLHYLLRSKHFIGVYNSISYGVRVGQWDMHYEDFKKVAIVDFKIKTKQFVKVYAQLAAIMPFNNVQWEMLHWYLLFLIPKLKVKTPEQDDLRKLLQSVDMNTYAMARVSLNERIELDDAESELAPQNPEQRGYHGEEDKDPLDVIVEQFNTRHYDHLIEQVLATESL